MTDLITSQQFLLLAITNLISGLFQGLAFAFAIVYIAKKFVPAWIHQVRLDALEKNAVEKALEGRNKYG